MQLGNALCIYGLVVIAYGIAQVSRFATRSRQTQTAARSVTPPKRQIKLPLGSLYLGFIIVVIGTLVSLLTSWYVHPVSGWLVGIVILSAITIWGTDTNDGVSPFPWQLRRHRSGAVDRSQVPAQLAEILQRKIGLARRNNESDSDYVHRAREHVERKLERRLPDGESEAYSTHDEPTP